MENLIVCIALYLLIIAIAYSPKQSTAATVDQPIDYFPTPEETTETPQPAIAATVQPVVTVATAKPATDNLANLTIRELYSRAKGKVKGYKSMSKVRLIQALRGLEPAQIAA